MPKAKATSRMKASKPKSVIHGTEYNKKVSDTTPHNEVKLEKMYNSDTGPRVKVEVKKKGQRR